MEFKEKKSEVQRFEGKSIEQGDHFTLGFGHLPNNFGDRMIDLNHRLLRFVFKSREDEDGYVQQKLEVEQQEFRETVTKLKVHYESKMLILNNLESEVVKLKSRNESLQKKMEDCQNLRLMCDHQRNTIEDLQFELTKIEKKLLQKTNECDDVRKESTDVKETIVQSKEDIEEFERVIKTYKEKLEIYECVSIQSASSEKNVELSLRSFNAIFSKMKDTFWRSLGSYYEKLETEFKREMKNFKWTKNQEYRKLSTMQQEKNDKLIKEVYKDKLVDIETISNLEKEKKILEQEVARLKIRVADYESSIELTSKEVNNFKVVLQVSREDDKRLEQQIDLYEVLTDIAEHNEDKAEAKKRTMTWEEFKNYFSEEPPFISEKLNSTKGFFEELQTTVMMSLTSETTQGFEFEYRQTQETQENTTTGDAEILFEARG